MITRASDLLNASSVSGTAASARRHQQGEWKAVGETCRETATADVVSYRTCYEIRSCSLVTYSQTDTQKLHQAPHTINLQPLHGTDFSLKLIPVLQVTEVKQHWWFTWPDMPHCMTSTYSYVENLISTVEARVQVHFITVKPQHCSALRLDAEQQEIATVWCSHGNIRS